MLAEIERLPGRHLYFLDDHLLGHRRFAATLFAGMRGMGRVFQGASTVNAILESDLIEQAAEAGLRSVFIGFEPLWDLVIRARRVNAMLPLLEATLDAFVGARPSSRVAPQPTRGRPQQGPASASLPEPPAMSRPRLP